MTTNTRDKLNEAYHFLEQLKEKQSERDVFRYNLSAFLSAARSVTLVMKKEFNKAPGFKEWYEKAEGAMKKDTDMKLFVEKRNITLKESPAKPKARVDVIIEVPTANLTINTFPPTVIITKADGTVERSVEPETTPSPITPVPDETKTEGKTITKWRWFFEELPDKDVTTACEEHIKKLESIVAECESLFT
jgi:hypothetical protein